MSTGRILVFALLLYATCASATPPLDPFVEDLRVGRHRAAEDLELVDGWPAGLFAPAQRSTAWEAAWAVASHDPAAFLDQAIGLRSCFTTDTEARTWLTDRIRLWETRDDLECCGDRLTRPAQWKGEMTMSVLDMVQAGELSGALARIDSLLTSLPDGSIDDLERFVWSLRQRALRAGLGRTPAPDVLWPELLDLGPYDRNSGWAIWSVHRRHLGRPLLPPSPGDLKTVLFLASLGTTGLTSRDIDRSPFARDAKSALGAAVLPKSALRRHFGLYPDLPVGARLQEYWLRGRWRLLGHTATVAEKLASLPGITHEHRAGYLRRAADKQASAGYWGSVVPNLRTAQMSAERSGKRRVIERIRHETERVAALSAHQGMSRASELLLELLDPRSTATENGRLASAADLVRAGQADRLVTAPFNADPTKARARAWRTWARLGARLARNHADLRWREYGDILDQEFAAGGPPTSPEFSARRAIDHALRLMPWRERALDWALACAMVERADGALAASETPITDLTARAKSNLEKHLLLGVSLLLGDARGQLATTVAMSRPGLTQDEYLLLLYPVPAAPFVMDKLRASGVDPALVLAVARNESLFDPAVRSRSGALGWMQIMPFHYPGRGYHEGEVVWRKLAASLAAGLDLLANNSRRYDGDPYRTLAAYNAGPSAVKRWDAQLGAGAPPTTFLAWIGYPETRRYVEKVLIDRLIYAWILRGAEGEQPAASETR